MANVEFKMFGVEAAQKMLDPKILKKATAGTINDMTKTSTVQLTKTIVKIYTLASKRVKKGLSVVFKANNTNQFGIIKVVAKTLSLSSFKHTFTPAKKLKTKTRPNKATVTVKRGRKKMLTGAFILPGLKPLFIDRSRVNYGTGKPITTMKGPSILGIFNAIQGARRIGIILKRKMDKAFWRRYNFLIHKAQRGRR